MKEEDPLVENVTKKTNVEDENVVNAIVYSFAYFDHYDENYQKICIKEELHIKEP